MSRRVGGASPRSRTWGTLLAGAATLGVAGCSSKDTHPAMAGGCDPATPCTQQQPPVGAGPETGTTADATISDGGASDGGLEIAVTGEVRRSAGFPIAPSTGTLATTGVDVQATRADGTTITSAPSAGTFTLPTVGRAADGAWLRVRSNSVVKTLAWVDTSGGDLLAAELPLFDDALPQVTATSVGLPLAVAGRATLVLHIHDASGAPLAGVGSTRANYVDTTVSYFGPYVDDGGDGITVGAKTTGARGTLVYLGIDPTAWALGFDVPLVIPSLGNRTVSFHVSGDTVSYREFVAK